MPVYGSSASVKNTQNFIKKHTKFYLLLHKMALYGHFVFLVFKISALFTKNPSIL